MSLVVDSSAVMAIVLAEPDAERLAERPAACDRAIMSAVTALNLGDCFTYALARRRRAPILCVGDDFIHTDAGVEPLG